LRTVGSAPITLDPCSAYARRQFATARSGRFSDPINSGYLPCTSHQAVIRPGHPLHWTIPATGLIAEDVHAVMAEHRQPDPPTTPAGWNNFPWAGRYPKPDASASDCAHGA
jgi:hypothetical protein